MEHNKGDNPFRLDSREVGFGFTFLEVFVLNS